VRWADVREFAVGCALATGAPNPKWAIDLLAVLSRYLIWARFTAAVPLDRQAIFKAHLIDRFVLTRMDRSLKHRQHCEKMLRYVAEAVGEPIAPRVLNVKITDARPYLKDEIPHLASWAQHQINPRTRQDAYSLLGFCGGAGLRGRELAALRRSEVEVTDHAIFVTVGGPTPRRIAVRPKWEGYVRRAIEGVEPDSYVVLPHAKADTRLHRLANFGRRAQGEAPRAARLRVTWVVHYLDILPLGSLLKAAGYTSPASLRRYVGIARSLEDDELFTLLRDGEVTS
jgi:integrase